VKDIHDVILRPVISEKSYEMLDENKYTFIVDRNANKTHIKQAVEKIFDVKVLSVNTMNRRGKVKRRGLIEGKRPDTKRAIVTVAPGDRIELFDAGL
jgi:large subunit ribosomal protein L23